MDPSSQAEIESLLRKGLDAYGTDDVDAAITCWKKVLELDPENSEALDYISSAELQDDWGDEAEVADESERDALLQALDSIASDPGAALDALAGIGEQTLEVEAARDLVRSHLAARYASDISPTDLPRPLGAAEVGEGSLPEGAGFVLSLIDGRTPVADIVSLSGMDRFDALHALSELVRSGHAEFQR